jgi:hypothetical protein
MIVAAERIGESPGHGGVLALLPQGDHDKLDPIGAANIDDVATLEVAHEDGSVVAGLEPTGGMGPGDARGDLGLLVERPADALAEPLGGVIGDSDEHRPGLWHTPAG